MKIISLLLTVGFFLFISCTDDGFKRISDNPQIQGTWKHDKAYFEISGEIRDPLTVTYFTLYSNNTGYYYSGSLSGDASTVAEIEWAFINNQFQYCYLGPAREKHGNGIRGFEIRKFDENGFWTAKDDYYRKATSEEPNYVALLKELYGESNNNDSNNDNNEEESAPDTNKGEVPDIWLEDYTCYSTQLQLVFRFESDDKVTSAEVNYGTSRTNLSKTKRATISGSAIRVNISGLINGDTYYIRAKAKNKNGQGVSQTMKITYQWKD
ncbi:fibronectin type III domain-containing protein [uncultured Bacteroides sp.]|uniref:fibronectin type III domain-containing protein n=1 Tax=uncultured Bacteroides sp. TaxID=162156 RepID=UPI002609ADF6|nr:fibronectin type III domain-containing protein [uncultured Bacteroides sp.]